MADYNIYRYTKIINDIEYKFHFHFGGKTGSNLGIVDLPPDAFISFETDISMPNNRLTGIEIARQTKITFNTTLLHSLYGDTFIDNLYQGSEVTGTSRNITLPSGSVVTFEYPNRLYITEDTGLGDVKVFDGLQKYEFSNFEFDESGQLECEFYCIGTHILQQILMNDTYLNPTYADLTFYNAGLVSQTMDGSSYATTTTQTHVAYNCYYNSASTPIRVEMKDNERPDIVFGSTSFKEIIDDIDATAEVMYDALTRAEASPTFIMTNSDTDNILHNLNLYSYTITGTTASSNSLITSYNGRLITAIFDFRENGGVLEIYKSDDLFENFEFKNAYDFINNLLEVCCSKATFTYGTGSVKLNWHFAKQSRFSSVSGDSNKSYAVQRFDKLGDKIQKYFGSSSGTNVTVPLLSRNKKDYEDNAREDLTLNYGRLNRFQAPTDEINLQFHNLWYASSNHRRTREVKNTNKTAWLSLIDYNGIYTNLTLAGDGGNYLALNKLSDYCTLELSSSESVASIDTGEALPIQDPADEKKSGSIYAKRFIKYIDNQRLQAGMPYVIGKAYNELYQNNQKLVVITDALTMQDFGKTVDVTNQNYLVSGYLYNKIESEFVITGIRTLFDGFYEVTMVSI